MLLLYSYGIVLPEVPDPSLLNRRLYQMCQTTGHEDDDEGRTAEAEG